MVLISPFSNLPGLCSDRQRWADPPDWCCWWTWCGHRYWAPRSALQDRRGGGWQQPLWAGWNPSQTPQWPNPRSHLQPWWWQPTPQTLELKCCNVRRPTGTVCISLLLECSGSRRSVPDLRCRAPDFPSNHCTRQASDQLPSCRFRAETAGRPLQKPDRSPGLWPEPEARKEKRFMFVVFSRSHWLLNISNSSLTSVSKSNPYLKNKWTVTIIYGTGTSLKLILDTVASRPSVSHK